jgi:hypothetical protein
MIERDGIVTGYAGGVGILSHSHILSQIRYLYL